MDVTSIDGPDDEGPDLLGVPTPVATPRALSPHGTSHECESPHHKADNSESVGQRFKAISRRKCVEEAQLQRLACFPSRLQKLHDREASREGKEAGAQAGNEHVDDQPS